MLKKLSNNNSNANAGHSALNFVMVVMVLMVLGCGFLDLINLVRLKSVINQQGNLFAGACIEQSGFRKEVPKDWKQVFGETCSNYMTKGKVIEIFTDAVGKTNGILSTAKVTLGGKNLASSNSDVTINWQEESKLECFVQYKLNYLNAFGLVDKTFTCKSSYNVVGFWIHKTSSI